MSEEQTQQAEPVPDVPGQLLFDDAPNWTEHWKGMPSYTHDDLEPWKSIIIHFARKEDWKAFQYLIGQKLGPNIKSAWYPEARIGHCSDRRYITTSGNQNPRYPVYIISKGRWESRLTALSLDAIGVPYRIVIEPQEYEKYAAVIEPSRILELPFSNLGQGSIPARNWVWDHAIRTGAARHWILDDNISGFYRFQNNLKCPVGDGMIFRLAEDFTERYENVPMSGFNYFMFVTRKASNIPPLMVNTRVYSCILLQNDIPYRWRGRYNEDTDLSLRILKDGYCTVLFNAFLARKSPTMTMKGGNTDQLYQGDGRLKMAESLKAQHPDLVDITEKWGRPQHHVNYKVFKQKLKLKPGVVIPEGVDDFGMSLHIDGQDLAEVG